MGTIPQTPGQQFLADLKALERRIADLERGERAPATSMRGGSFQVLDEDGNPRVVLGEDGDGSYGIEVRDGAGNLMLDVDASGMRAPYLPIHIHDADQGEAYNGAAFASTRWWIRAEAISHAGVFFAIAGYTEAGVTGEVRIRNLTAGTVSAARVYNAADGFTVREWRWLHGSPIGSGPVHFRVEARRTAGAGNFFSYDPNGAGLLDPALCTASGA
jgi:hypothetical protein